MKAYAVSTVTAAVVLNGLCEVLHDVTAAHTKTVNRKETDKIKIKPANKIIGLHPTIPIRKERIKGNSNTNRTLLRKEKEKSTINNNNNNNV